MPDLLRVEELDVMIGEAEITDRIHALRQGLNPTLRRVADLVLEQTAAAKSMNIKELAEAAEVSQATVSRFVRAMGAESYQDFRIMLAEGLSQTAVRRAHEASEHAVYEGIALTDDAASIISKVARRQADVITAASATLDPAELQKAASFLSNRQTILFLGMGSSLLAAEDGVMRFLRIGKACIFERDPNVQMFAIAGLADRATAVAVSDSGRTRTIVAALKEAKSLGMPTVAITSSGASPLARYADALLLTPATIAEPSGGEGIYESMVSKMAQLMVMDALYALVAVQEHDRALPRLDYTDSIIARSRMK
ncbi:MurR/RpiR family transcriptional regulator [Geminicoccus harenae]|uniref:MurR/RpiR family transcriptional regulator n=1 Tax=Geminicoccus harenae TaxID=2498453 RepID=UPI00168AA219|nr:MurR/RpiR family transcriptional regulator [Geminicoccus harenae]